MARLARIVVPGVPHHVTQRGNRRQRTFFCDEDYVAYKALVAEHLAAAGVECWAYCLMPNHVHLVLVPADEDGLRAGLAEAHRRYTRHINLRENWRGFLWQGRFASFPMNEAHLLACARYVESNPVRAGLVRTPRHWRWSSARAHLEGADDGLVRVAPLLQRVGDWKAFLAGRVEDDALERFRAHERTGRALGSAAFVTGLERQLKRTLRKRKPGPRPKLKTDDATSN